MMTNGPPRRGDAADPWQGSAASGTTEAIAVTGTATGEVYRAALAAAPKRGAWVTLTLTDGRSLTCRFVRAGGAGLRRWCVDHGAYGLYRDDSYIAERAIVSVLPAERPALLLSFREPVHGKRVYVGRYATREDAERALAPTRRFATDIRIETAP